MPDLTFLSPPRISEPVFSAVLAGRASPAATAAQSLYAIPILYDVDPAIPLGFFHKESSYGTAGIAKETLNLGNLRKGQGRHTGHRSYGSRGTFATYATWEDGLHDWCSLITRYYIPRGLDTVRKALPVYAPSSDNNNPNAYANTVITLVRRWQQQSGDLADPWAAWGTAYPLPEAERGFAIPQAWLNDGRLGAAQSPEMHADGGAFAARWFAGGVVVWERDGNRTTVVRGG